MYKSSMSDESEDECEIAVTCLEYKGAVIEDWDDRLIIGRRHAKSSVSVSPNMSLPDEFSDRRIKEDHDVEAERVSVPLGYLASKFRKRWCDVSQAVAIHKAQLLHQHLQADKDGLTRSRAVMKS